MVAELRPSSSYWSSLWAIDWLWALLALLALTGLESAGGTFSLTLEISLHTDLRSICISGIHRFLKWQGILVFIAWLCNSGFTWWFTFPVIVDCLRVIQLFWLGTLQYRDFQWSDCAVAAGLLVVSRCPSKWMLAYFRLRSCRLQRRHRGQLMLLKQLVRLLQPVQRLLQPPRLQVNLLGAAAIDHKLRWIGRNYWTNLQCLTFRIRSRTNDTFAIGCGNFHSTWFVLMKVSVKSWLRLQMILRRCWMLIQLPLMSDSVQRNYTVCLLAWWRIEHFQ